MKIVVLDGYAENPGDLSWEGLEALGDLTVYDRTPFAQGNDVVLFPCRLVGRVKEPACAAVIKKVGIVDIMSALRRGKPVFDGLARFISARIVSTRVISARIIAAGIVPARTCRHAAHRRAQRKRAENRKKISLFHLSFPPG